MTSKKWKKYLLLKINDNTCSGNSRGGNRKTKKGDKLVIWWKGCAQFSHGYIIKSGPGEGRERERDLNSNP